MHGRTDARTDNVKTVYPLQTKFAGGIMSCACIFFGRPVRDYVRGATSRIMKFDAKDK